ncbi:MAG: zf-HC2 domain-containing protein [Bryobacteraceae bacterium]
MTECWPDGALRAFLDRELPPEDLTRLSAHLEECPRCSLRCRELSARAVRVLELVGGLAEPAAAVQVARPPRKPIGMRRPHTGRWVAAAVALAAGWAALALLTPKHVQAPAHDLETHMQGPRTAVPGRAPVPATAPLADLPAPPGRASATVPAPVPASQRLADLPAPPGRASATVPATVPAPGPASQPLPVRALNRLTPRPMRRAFPAAPQRATLAGFVALDDDPIDAGVVMRVALAEGRMQADVIYSQDGRPRAIRLVNDATGK